MILNKFFLVRRITMVTDEILEVRDNGKEGDLNYLHGLLMGLMSSIGRAKELHEAGEDWLIPVTLVIDEASEELKKLSKEEVEKAFVLDEHELMFHLAEATLVYSEAEDEVRKDYAFGIILGIIMALGKSKEYTEAENKGAYLTKLISDEHEWLKSHKEVEGK